MIYDIAMCGIPRSGSTLVWQILQAVFPRQNIVKTHPYGWEPNGSIVVSSIRDPRDVVASLLRVRLSRERKTLVDPIIDLAVILRRTKLHFDKLKNDILIGHHTPVLRYEEFFDNYSIIYDMIENSFDIKIPQNIRKKLDSKYSLESNRSRAERQKDFHNVDSDQVHGDHIGHVVPGYWKWFVPKWSKKQIRKFCRPICKEWSYI